MALLAPALAWAEATPAALAGTRWQWVGLAGAGEALTIAEPARYTLEFLPEGRLALRADCHRGAGGLAFPAPGILRVGAIALTRALCPPGSLSDRFVQEVSAAARWSLRDGQLWLERAEGAATLRFAPAP
ncbi:MAG: META domain-containing protein [Rubritepida sp.]|nr:META domain-containing protein [Rubritepida sp.]